MRDIYVFLEGFVDDSRQIWRTEIAMLPFFVGRRPDCSLILASPKVSKLHAEIFAQSGHLWLKDKNSTNGTYLNGSRISEPQRLEDGDILYFADREFRLVLSDLPQATPVTETQDLSDGDLPMRLYEQSQSLRDMLSQGDVRASFQPVVRLTDSSVIGYELLGRGEIDGQEVLPGDLFLLAEMLGLAVELSDAFRHRGLSEAVRLPGRAILFINTHPAELSDGRKFLATLEESRKSYPDLPLVLEIHESAVAEIEVLRRLCAEFVRLDIQIAFDDFGTGQARLLELIELSPSYVKFDRAWITRLDSASQRRRDLVDRLVRMVAEMGIATVAEGIERLEEALACRALGFDFAQGYYFGRPAPVVTFG